MIELENVSYGYGAQELLSNVSLKLGAGSFHFLTGPSGAGKTTFLKLCYGALMPTSGHVGLLGLNMHSLDQDGMAMLRRRIGVVHQEVQFLDHLSVIENVALPLTVTNGTLDVTGDDLRDLMEWVGLTSRARAFPRELSGGESQRAALARALVLSPDVIFADEPTGNVDWDMSQHLLDLLLELNRMGKTVLMATHDMSLIRRARGAVPARVLRIYGGTIQQAGTEL